VLGAEFSSLIRDPVAGGSQRVGRTRGEAAEPVGAPRSHPTQRPLQLGGVGTSESDVRIGIGVCGDRRVDHQRQRASGKTVRERRPRSTDLTTPVDAARRCS